MKHLNWAEADRPVRIRLVKDAYTALVYKLWLESDEPWKDFRRAHNSGFYENNWFNMIVSLCEKHGFDGIEYIRAQFFFWPKSARYPIIPPLNRIAGGKRAMRNFQKWLDAKPSNAAYTPSQQYERAMSESQRLVEAFMRINPKEYPNALAVVQNPGIRRMLPDCYLESVVPSIAS